MFYKTKSLGIFVLSDHRHYGRFRTSGARAHRGGEVVVEFGGLLDGERGALSAGIPFVGLLKHFDFVKDHRSGLLYLSVDDDLMIGQG